MSSAPHAEAYNAAVDLLERNLVAGRSSRPYLLTETRAITYDEVISRANRVGSGLLGSGIDRGDRILLFTEDCPEFVITFWGSMKAGIVPVPLSPMMTSSDLQFILKHSAAKALLYDASVEPTVMAADLSGVKPFSVHGSSVHRAVRLEEIEREPEGIDTIETAAEDVAFWLYTSGTTGTPKVVPHLHRSLRSAPLGLSSQVLKMGSADVVLSVSRMFFAYGLGNAVYLPAAAAASVVVSDAVKTPAAVQHLISRHSPTLLFGVPSFYSRYVQLPDASPSRSIRQAISAGESLPAETFEQFKRRFGFPVLDGFGCTEAMHHVTSNRSEDAVPGSAGAPLRGFEVQVRDSHGNLLPEGQSGELWIRGPTLCISRVVDGWLRTGDLVQMRDGRLYHEGRLDDLMKLGGIWVAPLEIESVLRTHEAVEDVAVVMVHDARDTPVLKVFVRSARTDSQLHDELLQLCRARLAAFKVPRLFETVGELPRTATGKLRRFVLRTTSPQGEA